MQGESRSLGQSREGRTKLMMRKSGELLKCGKTLGSASTEPVIFCCGKTAAASLLIGDAAFFVMAVGRSPFPQPIRNPTEYCFMVQQGDPVKIRNNRPLLC